MRVTLRSSQIVVHDDWGFLESEEVDKQQHKENVSSDMKELAGIKTDGIKTSLFEEYKQLQGNNTTIITMRASRMNCKMKVF